MKNRPPNRWLGSTLATAFVALAVAMAGCSGPGAADDKGDNKAPNAVLESSGKNIGWTGESWTFDASKSDDPDGNILEYRFDFGDGGKSVATSEDQAKATHVFATGGEYTVTVTVIDDGKDQAGAESDMATKTVAVNAREDIPGGVVFAPPVDTGDETAGMYKQNFTVGKDADRIEATLEAASRGNTGESRIEVRVLNEEGDEIERQERTIAANSNETFDLNDMVLNNDPGTYTLEVLAHSGGAQFDGDIEIYYDAGYTN